MATAKTILFELTQEDLALEKEITLAGVIASKIAKGDYAEDPEMGQILASYRSCHEVNAALHRKLNKVRRALADDWTPTDSPEDEL
jgi:hypothetical protein